MKIVGKRFWIWMGVWALSLFVRGEMAARPTSSNQQEATATSSQHKSHKVPSPAYTRHKLGTQDIHEKTSSGLYDKRKGKVTHKVSTTPEIGKTSSGARLKADAGSKDPAYMMMHKVPNKRK